ncbi:MAG: hypothetical protein L6R41_005650 [Letrouitia leprolyta]|nr:MAG: hypothetical protein L6R41_005650 [Letrouitia leprolyta]
MLESNQNVEKSKFAVLPREIQNEILFYLLLDSNTINPKYIPELSHSNGNPVYQAAFIDVTTSSREIFYKHNVFDIDVRDIKAFLDYKADSPFPNPGKPSTPRQYIRHLALSFQPFISDVDYNAGPEIQEFLDCPTLKSLHIRIQGFFEAQSEFDQYYWMIRPAFLELGRRLGPDSLYVDLAFLYGRAKWSIADFARGQPPNDCCKIIDGHCFPPSI